MVKTNMLQFVPKITKIDSGCERWFVYLLKLEVGIKFNSSAIGVHRPTPIGRYRQFISHLGVELCLLSSKVCRRLK